jgi:glycosyltransferase involved in cell wall biosynthesis
MKLSVAIIVKDREKELANCLKSVRGADEIVVLDTGSIDSTPRIAINNGAKVYYYRWDDDFSAARNRCLDYVHNSWVLSIDSDEVLEGGIQSVFDCINQNFSSRVIGIKILQPDRSIFYGKRLFRRENSYWIRRIHEEINGPANLVTDEVVIRHTPAKDHKNDPQRNIRLLRKTLELSPLSIMDIYYLGEELFNNEQWDAALYWLQLFLETAHKTPDMTPEAYYLVAECYCKLQRVGKAIENLVAAVTQNPQFKAAYELLYRLTKNETWRNKAMAATNKNIVKVR